MSVFQWYYAGHIFAYIVFALELESFQAVALVCKMLNAGGNCGCVELLFTSKQAFK